MFEPRIKLGHNMFSLSDGMVNNSSFVDVLPVWTKRLLDAFCGNSQTWHQGHFPFRQNVWLEIPRTFPIKWKGFPDIELRFQSHCLHEPFFRYLGFFLSSLQNSNAIRNAWTCLNKCLRTLNCFIDKQITIFTFVFLDRNGPKIRLRCL